MEEEISTLINSDMNISEKVELTALIRHIKQIFHANLEFRSPGKVVEKKKKKREKIVIRNRCVFQVNAVTGQLQYYIKYF